MKKVSFAVFLLLIFCSVAFAAIKDSPDGFRGIKWGDPLSALGASTLIEDAYGLQSYVRHNENLKMGEANLTAVAYCFREKKYLGTVISSKGVENSLALKAALLLRYGAEFDEIPGGLAWMDTNAMVAYQYLPEYNITSVIIANTITFMELLEALEKSTASDF